MIGRAARDTDPPKQDVTEPSARYTALVIGNVSRWTIEGRALADCASFQFRELDALQAETLAALSPDIILSPLFGDDFDVMDVAAVLQALGFRGQYRAITESLPNANMIRAEVSAHAPDVDFDLLMMPPIANDG